jgi:probable aminopeptidase NPEPL1
MRITYPAQTAGLPRSSQLLVVARAKAFAAADGAAALRRLLGGEAAAAALALAARTTPGLLGAAASTLLAGRGDAARQLGVGVLANAVAAHNCPARAEAVRKVVAAWAGSAPLGGDVLLLLEDGAHVLPAVVAVARALPSFTRKTSPRRRREGSVAVHCCDERGRPLRVPDRAAAIAAQARWCAELVDTPPSELDPARLAAAARARLRSLPGVRVRELQGNALLRAGLRGIHAVGRAASVPPRLLVASVGPGRGAPARGRHSRRGGQGGAAGPPRHIALVGKGITFDTGGLHLKARGAMEGMKSDMGGAAAVLGAFAVLARQRLPVRLTAVVCLAENAIGPGAYKPDDILTLHSGKTVEINNTDAEGRLLLADGLSFASRDLRADLVIDAATLTGAQLIATGNLHAAVVSNDERLQAALVAAGTATGDLAWPLPFVPEFYKSEFHSPVADMRNSVKNRNNAQSSCAATFVHWHIEDTGARWAHVDLAGPAFVSDRGTGFGVALLVEAVRQLAGHATDGDSRRPRKGTRWETRKKKAARPS